MHAVEKIGGGRSITTFLQNVLGYGKKLGVIFDLMRFLSSQAQPGAGSKNGLLGYRSVAPN